MQFMIFNHPTNSHSKLHTSIMDLPAYAGYDYGDFFHYSSFFTETNILISKTSLQYMKQKQFNKLKTTNRQKRTPRVVSNREHSKSAHLCQGRLNFCRPDKY